MHRLLLGLATLVGGAAALPAQAQELACEGGVVSVPDVGAFACDGVGLAGRLPVDAFATEESPAAGANNDIWGWTDPETGTEYALVGTENGTAFVDLSIPTRPRLVGKLPTQSTPSGWRDVKTYRDHAFVVSEARGHGVQVFDLTRLRDAGETPVTFAADAVYDRLSSAHNIVIDEETGFAYAVGSRPSSEAGLPASCDVPGFHAINIQDPKSPTFAGCFSDAAVETGSRTPGYTHDAQCVVYRGPDADYAGRELCVASNEDVVTVFDVTDKSDARIVSQAEYPGEAYTHQGWLTDDQRFFLVNDELDEMTGTTPTQRTILFDLGDLDAPEFIGAYDSGLTTADHNLYIRGGYAFESNYEAGLRIVDLGGVASGKLREVAFFDTYPDANAVSFSGQWSNYPYFESGLVIANDRAYGLFVLRPDVLRSTASEPRPDGTFALSAPAPNPTPGTARLTLQVATAQTVRADLYDAAGRHVRTLYAGEVGAGRDLALTVDGAALTAGVYVVRVVGDGVEATRRVTFVR
ncbi:choice-of-anchor B family protein [Rubrivirga sp. S365]|uniref:Choice-of-anchor B family protein n=1 Tax=Rubrivirga litoralis TaxID=3075598 RepID=A0ABU3BRJ5_9BACT|nr:MULTISPECIES: choice-of-anchor B family protein [unclassified Rubrivirga]MDT0631915.1 choice-of-anchor B family protein [Rubrivirga sp. F394]MDT7857968.1 choice-of-anchor B family protein [Rubrivirga sp. S365]